MMSPHSESFLKNLFVRFSSSKWSLIASPFNYQRLRLCRIAGRENRLQLSVNQTLTTFCPILLSASHVSSVTAEPIHESKEIWHCRTVVVRVWYIGAFNNSTNAEAGVCTVIDRQSPQRPRNSCRTGVECRRVKVSWRVQIFHKVGSCWNKIRQLIHVLRVQPIISHVEDIQTLSPIIVTVHRLHQRNDVLVP